eukprot:1152508_1
MSKTVSEIGDKSSIENSRKLSEEIGSECDKDNTRIRKEEIWILIQGCVNAPPNIRVSKKKGSKSNHHLIGMALDTANMEFFINNDRGKAYFYTGISSNDLTTTEMVLNEMKETCKYAKHHKAGNIAIYYTGHSEHNTGNWVFSNGVISLHQIITTVVTYWQKQDFQIYCDCDYSGLWVKALYKYRDGSTYPDYVLRRVSIHGACWPNAESHAYDSPVNGGYFTLALTQKKHRPHLLDEIQRCRSRLNMHSDYTIWFYSRNVEVKRMKAVQKMKKKGSKAK